jgi:hypothetical protein
MRANGNKAARTSDHRTGSRASVCISYTRDADGNMIAPKVFSTPNTRTTRTARTTVVRDTRPEVLRYQSIVGNIGNVE